MRQHVFLTDVLSRLESEKGQVVMEDMAKLKRTIAHESDLILHAAGW